MSHRLLYHTALGLRVKKKKKDLLAVAVLLVPICVALHPTHEQVLHKVLVFKAHRWLYHSTLGSRVIRKKKRSTKCFGFSRYGNAHILSQVNWLILGSKLPNSLARPAMD